MMTKCPPVLALRGAGRVGNYGFNRIGYHVGSLTWPRTKHTRRRVDLVSHAGPDLPETFERRRASDAHRFPPPTTFTTRGDELGT